MPHSSDLNMTRAIAAGDNVAWNTFIQHYGDLIMSAAVSWLEADSRVPRSQYASILRVVQGNLPEPAEEKDLDREGLALYRYVLEQLRPMLAEYRGESSLGSFLRLALREIRHRYLTEAMGRLTVPAPVLALSPLAQSVYKLRTHEASREAVAARLGVGTAEVAEAEREIRRAMQGEGKEWWALERWPLAAEEAAALAAGTPCPQREHAAAYFERAAAEREAFEAHLAVCPQCRARLAFLEEAAAEGGIAPTVAVPAWVNRDVMIAEGGSPTPAAKANFWQKVFSQPDWLLGVVLGGITAAVMLIVVLPRTDYSKEVRLPEDVIAARAATPLSPDLAAQLENGRMLLSRSKVDAALHEFEGVIAARPDSQEARWLLATTYDRQGDRVRAALHYRAFLETEAIERQTADSRIKRAETRLADLGEMP